MSKNYNLDGDIYRIVDIPISELEGQKLAPMEYEGIYRLDNGLYLKAFEWLAQEWAEEEGPEPLGGVYYNLYTSLTDDAIDIDGGVMGYDLNSTLEDFNEFLAEAGQGQITRKIGVVL
jgi:hypothetical protein